MLAVTNLRKDFSTIRAVDSVTFAVARGEILGLIGRNGAGKTTTIRCVLRILEPNEGEVLFDGKPFFANIRNTIGFLPEERGLYKKSKVLDTILYFAELRGMERGKAKSEALGWLQRFDLANRAMEKVDSLSKGNQQKIQFITAVIHDPQLLILDEPFSGLDPVNQIIFKEIVLELKQRGKAIIFSTHQMDHAEKLSDGICLIDHGRVVLSGSVHDVKKRHGINSVWLEYEGDGTFLSGLSGVKRSMLNKNSAELLLEDGITAQQLLAHILEKVDLRKFEFREPSLESIFIQTVGKELTETVA